MLFKEEKDVKLGTGKWIITINGDEWNKTLVKAKNKIKNEIIIPGFRKGKAPESEVNKFLTKDKIYTEAYRIAVSPMFDFAIDNPKSTIKPFTSPAPKVSKIDDNEMTVEFIFDLKPEIKLAEYKNITDIEKTNSKVTKKEIEESIKSLREENAMEEIKDADGVIENNDIVVFDFIGYINEKPFEGGSQNDFKLIIGSNKFIPGFETSMIGLKVGDNQEIKVVFPENYVESLRNKEAKFVLNIKSIAKRKIPKLDEEFVKDLNIKDIDSVSKLEDKIKKDLEIQKENNDKNEFILKVLDHIIDNSDIQIPKSTIEKEFESLKKEFEDKLQQQGVTIDKYIEITGIDEKVIEEELMTDAKRKLSNYLVYSQIFEKEKLEVTKEMIENKYEELSKSFSMKVDEIKKIVNDELLINEIKNELINNFLYENNGKK